MALEPLWGPVKPPAGSKKIGETDDGTPIWRLERPRVVGKRAVKINGVEQWVMAGQTPIKPRMENIVETETVEFVMVPQPNGGAFMNLNFRPDPEEIERMERRRRVADVTNSLAEKLVERGLSVDALLDAVAGTDGDKPRRKSRAVEAEA